MREAVDGLGRYPTEVAVVRSTAHAQIAKGILDDTPSGNAMLVTGAGIEPAARALKVRCSTTELPGRTVARHWWSADSDGLRGLTTGYLTVNPTDASVVSHAIATSPPRAEGSGATLNVNCSTGVSSVRFVSSIRPRSADAL